MYFVPLGHVLFREAPTSSSEPRVSPPEAPGAKVTGQGFPQLASSFPPPGCDTPHGCGPGRVPQLFQELVVCSLIVVYVHVGIRNYLLSLDFECWNIKSHLVSVMCPSPVQVLNFLFVSLEFWGGSISKIIYVLDLI